VEASVNDDAAQPRGKAPLDDLGATPQACFQHRCTICVLCGGAVRIVANIEEPTAIRAIRAHFAKHGALEEAHYRPRPRGPPAVAKAA
jgi:hypothetical protein